MKILPIHKRSDIPSYYNVKEYFSTFALITALFLALSPLLRVDAAPLINEYSLPDINTQPGAITSGPDGALWFTESSFGRIGRINTNGEVSEYDIPPPSGKTYPAITTGITSGPDGALWFTEGPYNVVGRLTVTGSVTQFTLPTPTTSYPSNYPNQIVTGPDGALWFTEQNSNKIGRITTSGQITEYLLPMSNGGPLGITSGPDGALWFTDNGNHSIGRITTSGNIIEYPRPSNFFSSGITSGPDGALWFTDSNNSIVGRITTLGVISEYQLGEPSKIPGLITSGPDGALWFTEYANKSIARITTSGFLSEYPIPTSNNNANGIVEGPDSAIWFTEGPYSSNIGRLDLNLAPSSVNLAVTSPTQYPFLSWPSSSEATSYNIYRNGTKVDSTTDTTYTDSSAPEGTDTYYVTAVNSSGESAPSNSVDVVVDRTAPTVVGTPDSSPNSNGWYNQDVGITWTSTDPSPSSGTPTQPPVTLASTEGDHIYTSDQSCDPAANCATGSLEVKLDKTAPTISYTVAPAPNSGGWNNSAVTVTFTCDDALSGVASCTAPVTVSAEGASQTVTGTATDNAGNTATINASVSLDATAPTITASLSQQPNANGWFNSATTVSYTCSDGLSGIAFCASPQAESTDGMYTLSGSAVDNAGNTSDVLTQVDIDTTSPTVSNLSWTANPVAQGGNTTLSVNATDNLSGVAGAYYTVNGGAPQAMAYGSASGAWQATFGASLASNTYDITVYAVDQAGNTSTSLTDVLAVAATGAISGHAKLLPAGSDTLPIAQDTSVHNPADLVVAFGGPQTANTSTEVQYVVKNNKDEFDVKNTTVEWIVIPDSTHASLMLHGDLVTYVNGAMTTTSNVTMRIDVVLNANSSGQDLVTVRIWDPGQDPNADQPAYYVSEYDQNGSNISMQ